MITIYGDAILDVYMNVEFVKPSPESTGNVYRLADGDSYSLLRLGGAAAVAAIMRYYCNPDLCLVAPIGLDDYGKKLENLLIKHKINHELDYIKKIITTTKYRHVYQGRLLQDRFDKQKYYPYTVDFVPTRTLVISDYGVGACHNIAEKIEVFRHTSNIIVDPFAKCDWLECYKGAHVIKCNMVEANAQVKLQRDKHNKCAFDYPGLAELLNCFLIITDGPSNIQIWKHNTKITVDVLAVDNILLRDVTGCGDTITAILAAELDKTPKEITFKMITDALHIAARYAAEQVKHLGVAYDLTFTS